MKKFRHTENLKELYKTVQYTVQLLLIYFFICPFSCCTHTYIWKFYSLSDLQLSYNHHDLLLPNTYFQILQHSISMALYFITTTPLLYLKYGWYGNIFQFMVHNLIFLIVPKMYFIDCLKNQESYIETRFSCFLNLFKNSRIIYCNWVFMFL